MQFDWSEWPPKTESPNVQLAELEPQFTDVTAATPRNGRSRAGAAIPLRFNAKILTTGVHVKPVATPTPVKPADKLIVDHRLRPNIHHLLVADLRFRQGVTRDKITGPLSPVVNPTDETLFEDAANPQAKLYLPRYRVSEQTVGGKPQFRLRLAAEGQAGSLTVFLEKFPAPAVDAASRQGQELPHSVAIKLVARVPMGASHVQQEMTFQEITAEGSLLKAVLRLENLAQLTQVFQVLTDASYSASLVVLRSTNTAWPVPVDQNAVKQFTTEIQKLQQEITALNTQSSALAARIKVIQRQAALMPQMKAMVKTLTEQQRKINEQRAAKTQQAQQKQSQLNTLQSQKLFRVTPYAIPCAVGPSPFVFPKELHGYIFSDIVPNTSGRVGFVAHQVTWQGRSHTYYQQSLAPQRVMFLPDCFKVPRRPETPHYPMLTVRFPNPDAPPETMPVTLEYVAEPIVQADRLEAAAVELKRKIPELAQGNRQIEFEPLLCDTAKLFLTLPRGDAGPQREEQKDAQIDLRTKLAGAVTLPMRDFQGIYDALFGESAVVFQGSVVVALDAESGVPPENIPLICRLTDLSGDIFDVEVEQDAGKVRAKLTNATESPVELRGLRAVLGRAGSQVEGVIEGLAFAAPIPIPAGGSVSCTVSPGTALSGEGAMIPLFDLSQVTVRPEAEAVWGVIVDQTRLPDFRRTITVKTIKQTFEGSDPVVAVVVDFERGESVDLSAEKLTAQAEVRIPLTDFVIRRVDSGEYRYKVTVIRAGGQTKDTEWRTDRTGILFPAISQAASG